MRDPATSEEERAPLEDFEPDEADRPQRRREWNGAARSLLLPMAIVLAVTTVVWQLQRSPSDGEAALVQLDAGREAGEDGGEGAPRTGEPAPAFTLPALAQEQVELSQFRDGPVLINFWATWCGPCRQEMPLLASYAERHQEDGLVVLAVNLQESRDEVSAFVEQYGLDFPVLLDVRGDVMRQYRVMGVPSSFFVDRAGVIRAVFFGPLEEADLDRLLPSILAPEDQ